MNSHCGHQKCCTDNLTRASGNRPANPGRGVAGHRRKGKDSEICSSSLDRTGEGPCHLRLFIGNPIQMARLPSKSAWRAGSSWPMTVWTATRYAHPRVPFAYAWSFAVRVSPSPWEREIAVAIKEAKRLRRLKAAKFGSIGAGTIVRSNTGLQP
jgi:hypothetical protein